MYNSDENVPLRGDSLSEKMDVEIRHGFIRKVFAIVSVQLLVTAAIAAPFTIYNAAAHIWIQNNSTLIFVASFMPLILICYAMCNPNIVREYPKNYVFLGAITGLFGLLTGVITAQYTAQSIAYCVAATCVIVFALMLFACQTKHDFTGMGPYLFVFMLVLCAASLLMMFLPTTNPDGSPTAITILYSSLGVCLFSFYIVYDTQLIVGGKHSAHRFGVDEYAFAALNLYLDIIQLFLHLLRLMGDRR